MQLAMNAWVKCSLGEDFSVQSGVQYFPRPFEDLTDRFPRKWTTFFMVALSMAIVPLPFMYSLVLERATGAKQLESLSGTRPYDYWRGHFAFDIIIYHLVVTPVLIALLLSGMESDQAWLTLIIFVVYGFTMFTYLYALQFFFMSPRAAVGFLFVMNIVVGVVLSAFVVSSSLKGHTTQELSYFMAVTISVLSPNFVLTGFIYLLTLQPSSFVFPVVIGHNDASVLFCLPINYIYYLLCQMTFSWLVVAFFEFTLDRRLGNLVTAVSTEDDSPVDFVVDADVAEEAERIEHAHKSELIRTYSLVLRAITKQYYMKGTFFTAVSNLSVGLSEGDCLGLLGPKGAGKTTVCQMVTGEIGITSGQIFMHGLNTRKHFKRTQSMIGYCPQHDEMPVQLTGREALYMFARLRGVPSDVIHQVVGNVIDLTTLSPYEDQLIKNYSLGFKRRVSVAAAIIGAPRFILLDEPTAGMDGTAKQILWTVLQNIRAAGKTLIVATRSFEECEALCTHVAVMVKGHMVSFGSPEHLKLKYNRGHCVTIYASANVKDDGGPASLIRAQEYIMNAFVNTKLFARSDSYVELFVPETVKLSALFEVLESGKSSSHFQNYRVQHISWEQILLRFMKTGQ
ncbi:Retinal-specific ATP-binding cassette transporter [Bulinus truncatus]|nr:Retinal-specific ATP-binding cassette transporter [Bulinus truncatus]